ncbi:hypothetical protein CONPUDRAFT_94608 [Coniophora puteana RWD-64-598 SS2]|uniref:Kinetochore protein SPC25 n=1 Tax=Coniophora puteana (strain RWD-64-598) TaxID=741705 RepID=A0A5M3N4D0_CONPW|nr:uncharacterized protein CONPUDRAFT_94608 [Coniophora puteana RWD-64-598 SS2]EIW86282.1 hypothetical protein CONPUDRAFT_94608 [Coniophora puteana RWD-64-598 SS2]
MPTAIRPAHIDLASILADPNPQIDLRLQAFDVSTNNFVRAVTNYTNRAITEISKHRNAQASDKKRILERAQAVEADTNQCKLREIELLAVMNKEQDEKRESEQSIAALKRQLASIREKCASFDTEIQQYRSATEVVRREKEEERRTLESYASSTTPELAACEMVLGCTITGIETDRLLIRFAHLDPANPQRICDFVLDVSSQSYKVPTTTPSLPDLPILLTELNETRNIFRFIRQMRQSFLSLYQDDAQ